CNALEHSDRGPYSASPVSSAGRASAAQQYRTRTGCTSAMPVQNKTRGLWPRALFWWAIPISARTQNITKGNGIGILFEVEVQHHTVLKDIDRVDEVVDELPLVHRAVCISLPEPLKPEQDLFPAQSRPLQFFFQD